MAQFRVEFVLDQATGKYLAELYDPDNQQELVVRTEAMYPTQAAAVLGLVQLFKDAVLKFPPPAAKPRVAKPARKPAKKKPVRKKAKAKAKPTKAKARRKTR